MIKALFVLNCVICVQFESRLSSKLSVSAMDSLWCQLTYRRKLNCAVLFIFIFQFLLLSPHVYLAAFTHKPKQKAITVEHQMTNHLVSEPRQDTRHVRGSISIDMEGLKFPYNYQLSCV